MVGASLGLYVGNLRLYVCNQQVLWGMIEASLGAVGWQPTCLMAQVGASLGLQVGNLQVLWGIVEGAWGCLLATYRSYGAWLERVWGCMLATYRSYGACWSEFGAVCWQPTGLMGHVGASLGRYVGNLQVLWGMVGASSGL